MLRIDTKVRAKVFEMTDVRVTKDSLQAMLDRSNPAYVEQVIGRALVGLYQRQTKEEQFSDATLMNNGIGFTGSDGRSGALSAKYFLKHGKLQDWVVAKWTKKNDKGYARLAKYHRQLNEIALEREQEFENRIRGAA